MNSHFEWMRILMAMGMMTIAFVLLPMFFLSRDRRARERADAAEAADATEAADALVGRRPDNSSSG